MSSQIDFDTHFKCLIGLEEDQTPFPWQEKLFDEYFCQKLFRNTCDIPTGLGKTSIIAIWLLALAHHVCSGTVEGFPRRIVYVVNRRTVVDQATREAEQMREALRSNPALKAVAESLQSLGVVSSDVPLAISTLRGQFADNAEWRNDPARPAVIIGTVDMVGSRLLFSGYGRGFKSRPLHAGFLGQDTLLVHDEAHLEPAFQKLIEEIKKEQNQHNEFRMFHVMALTATARSDANSEKPLFTADDRKHPEVWKRIEAKKRITFHPVNDEKKIPDEVAKYAMELKDSGQAILIFLRKLKHVEKVVKCISNAGQSVQTLTGTLRGLERDALAKKDPIFARFMPKPEATPQQGTVYLVCTSAGEVGVNISADHLVCDLTPFDSMAQRFGRVNRFGNGCARIDVVYFVPTPDDDTSDTETKAKADDYEVACSRTLSLLQQLPKRDDGRHDASPAALNNLPAAERQAAFTPQPVILPSSDILFDSWALTSVRQELPGRPPVANWLHGVAEWEPPETRVAWREEVTILTEDLLRKYPPEDLLEDCPIKPHELLRDSTDMVFKHLETIEGRCPELKVWLLESDDKIRVLSLRQLVEKNKLRKPVENLADCTVVLPPEAGGLEKGLLDGNTIFDETRRDRYDVSDRWTDQNNAPFRCRAWDDEEPPRGMRLIRTIDIRPDADEEEEEPNQTSRRRYWYWYVRPRLADDDGSKTASKKQELAPHLQSAERFARDIVAKLGLNGTEAMAVTLAASWHDLGKDRALWQRSIGNFDYPRQVLAKSGGKMRSVDLSDFRHEFGSLLDIQKEPEFQKQSDDMKDLILHLIAAHHGRARPHFPVDEVFDPAHQDETASESACEVPRRFARLQRKYGRWGLAYLESLVRAADALASQVDYATEVKPDDATQTQIQEASQ